MVAIQLTEQFTLYRWHAPTWLYSLWCVWCWCTSPIAPDRESRKTRGEASVSLLAGTEAGDDLGDGTEHDKHDKQCDRSNSRWRSINLVIRRRTWRHILPLQLLIMGCVALFFFGVYIPAIVTCLGGPGEAASRLGAGWSKGAVCFAAAMEHPIGAFFYTAVTLALPSACCGSLLALWVTDPGIVATPSGLAPTTTGDLEPFAQRRLQDSTNGPTPQRSANTGGRWAVVPMRRRHTANDGSPVLMYQPYCRTCDWLRTPRTSHCSLCNVCVAEFDHHCGVIDTCVGRGNIRWFILFVLSAALLCDWVGYCCVAALYWGPMDGRGSPQQAVAICMLCVIGMSAIQLHIGVGLYARLYLFIGVTLREHRKQGSLFPGRDLATKYEDVSRCMQGDCCDCCSSGDDAPEGSGLIPRPFDKGVARNCGALWCPCAAEPTDVPDGKYVVSV